MKIFFRPLKKEEASKIVLIMAKAFKIIFLVAAFFSFLASVIAFSNQAGFTGILLGLIAGTISFFLIMLSSLLVEALLIGASIIIENHYKSSLEKEKSNTTELLRNTEIN